MKLLVVLVALLSIIGSGLLFLHKPTPHAIGLASNSADPRTVGTPGPTPVKPVVVEPPPVRPESTAKPGVPNTNGVVNVYGAADVLGVINEVRTDFEKRDGAPRVETKPLPMDEARHRLESSSTFDFALINRVQADDEKHLKANPVAYRGLCLVVNAANPVASLTASQVSDIYLGKNTKWTEVGGPEAPITLYQFTGKANPVKAFDEFFKINAKDIVPAVGQSDDAAEVVRKIGLDAGGIAFVPYIVVASQQDREAAKVKLVALDGIDPSAATIRDGTYPLGLPVILLTRGEPEDGPARDFLRYVNSDTVQGKDGVLRKSLLLLPGR